MSKFQESLAKAVGKPGHPLKMGVILTELPEEEARDIHEALRDMSIPSAQISRALKMMGISCSERAIANWRTAHVAVQ